MLLSCLNMGNFVIWRKVWYKWKQSFKIVCLLIKKIDILKSLITPVFCTYFTITIISVKIQLYHCFKAWDRRQVHFVLWRVNLFLKPKKKENFWYDMQHAEWELLSYKSLDNNDLFMNMRCLTNKPMKLVLFSRDLCSSIG